jgi:hypothetical protein
VYCTFERRHDARQGRGSCVIFHRTAINLEDLRDRGGFVGSRGKQEVDKCGGYYDGKQCDFGIVGIEIMSGQPLSESVHLLVGNDGVIRGCEVESTQEFSSGSALRPPPHLEDLSLSK